jgi:hypothetical protein
MPTPAVTSFTRPAFVFKAPVAVEREGQNGGSAYPADYQQLQGTPTARAPIYVHP